MAQPRVLENGSKEKKRLWLVADTLNILVDGKRDYRFYVDEVYFDLGQEWMWTTIIAWNKDPWKEFQLLCPRDWEQIVEAETETPIECLKIGERIYREEGGNRWL